MLQEQINLMLYLVLQKCRTATFDGFESRVAIHLNKNFVFSPNWYTAQKYACADRMRRILIFQYILYLNGSVHASRIF